MQRSETLSISIISAKEFVFVFLNCLHHVVKFFEFFILYLKLFGIPCEKRMHLSVVFYFFLFFIEFFKFFLIFLFCYNSCFSMNVVITSNCKEEAHICWDPLIKHGCVTSEEPKSCVSHTIETELHNPDPIFA
jgi:hypothetical protein